MKKTICIILIVICIAGAVGVAAQFSENAKILEPESNQTDIYTVYDKPQAYEEVQLSDKSENAVFQMLNRSGKAKNEIYNDIFMYKYFLKMYNPSIAERTYIDTLILKGADVFTMISIFDFWRTTAEDIDMIGKIYAKSADVQGAYWIEEVFNELTENRHGVLDKEAINEYFEKGLTKDDILQANILCRKGVYTITEILDKVAVGEAWEDIIAAVEQNATGKVEAIGARGIRSSRYGETAEGVRINAVENEIHLEMLADGLVFREEITETDEYFIAKAVANGMSNEEIEQLLDEGYRAVDILNASEESKVSEESTETILSEQRASMTEGRGGEPR